MAAFVLGNGQSRASVDVDLLLSLGRVYGCNAIYRSHTPTVLVSTDKPIAQRIQESGYSAKHRFYTRRPMPNLGALAIPQPYFGFSSGPVATAIAALDKQNPIYLLGFDMGPSDTGKFNNIFADTEFYKRSHAPPTFVGNWTRQLVKITQDFPSINFTRVHGVTTAEIDQFAGISNLKKMPLDEFLEIINTTKDL